MLLQLPSRPGSVELAGQGIPGCVWTGRTYKLLTSGAAAATSAYSFSCTAIWQPWQRDWDWQRRPSCYLSTDLVLAGTRAGRRSGATELGNGRLATLPPGAL